MKRLALTTALTLVIAAPAFANDQLARSVGVEPGTYTTAKLVELKSAMDSDDYVRIHQLKRENAAGGYTVSSKNAPSAGHVQLARSLGVDAGSYSVAELAQLKQAFDNDDYSRIRQLKSENAAGGYTVSSKSAPSAGHVQIARSIGVEPSDYTFAEVVELRDHITQENWFRVNQLMKR